MISYRALQRIELRPARLRGCVRSVGEVCGLRVDNANDYRDSVAPLDPLAAGIVDQLEVALAALQEVIVEPEPQRVAA